MTHGTEWSMQNCRVHGLDNFFIAGSSVFPYCAEGESNANHRCISSSSGRPFKYCLEKYMNKWTRRSMLFGGAFVVLPTILYGGGKLWCSGFLPSRTQKANVSLLTSLYPDTALAGAFGKKYLSLVGSTASAAFQRLQKQKRIAVAAELGCLAETAVAVERACRADFRAGRVYCIDGWVLAQTELDVAALCILA